MSFSALPTPPAGANTALPPLETVRTVRGFTMLSVVLPCYRIGESLSQNLRAVAQLLAPIPFELIPVDDGSEDGTAELLRKTAAALPCVKPVLLPKNRGKGAALQAGFATSSGSHILLLDGDLDLSPAYIWRFFEIFHQTGSDVVIGSKLHPESDISYPLRRRIASFVYYGFVKLLLGLPVHDTQTGMKLFSREALSYACARMLSKRYAFDLEILAILHRAHFRISEAPIQLDFGQKSGCLTPKTVCEVMQDTLAIFYRCRILHYYKKLSPPQAPATDPFVSVIIACPGNSGLLQKCIAGIAAQNYPQLEALVLPDEDFSEAEKKTLPAFVKILPTGRVRPSEKRNLGIARARGEIIAFLDDDATPLEDWIRRAVPYFSDPAVGGVGGPAITPQDETEMAFLSGLVYANPLVSGGCRRRYIPLGVCSEEDLPSCNLFVRSALLRELGGFNTQYWPGEDTILCLELTHKQKKRLMYDPGVLVAHHRRPLFLPHLRQISRYARHRGYFARRFPETSRRLSYAIPSLLLIGTAGTVLCAVLSLLLPAAWPLHVCARTAARTGGGVLAFYLTLVLTFSLSRPLSLHRSLYTALGIIATHYTYGAAFLIGLFGPDRARPSAAVKGFDHRVS